MDSNIVIYGGDYVKYHDRNVHLWNVIYAIINETLFKVNLYYI